MGVGDERVRDGFRFLVVIVRRIVVFFFGGEVGLGSRR